MSNPKDILKKASEALSALSEERKQEKNRFEQERKDLILGVASDIAKTLQPYLESQSKLTKRDLIEALSTIKIQSPAVHVPALEIPPITVPRPQVTVNVPELKVPKINVEPTPVSFPDLMTAKLHGIDPKNPLPVMLHTPDGKPYTFPQIVGNVGGGRSNAFVIMDILTAAGNSVMDTTNNAVQVNLVASSGVLAVSQVSGRADSTNIIQLGGTNIATDSGVTGPGVLRVVQATDVGTSVNVIGFTSSVGVNALNSDGVTIDPRDRNWSLTETLSTKQVSGAVDSIEIASQQVSLLVQQLSGANFSVEVATQPITFDTRQVSGANQSVEIASQQISLGVLQASGSSFSVEIATQQAGIEVKQVSGFVDSVNVLQLAGTSVAVDQGVSNAGTLRVVQAVDVATSVRINATDVALDIKQVSGSVDSVEIASQQITLGVFQGSGFTDSVNVLQFAGNGVSTNQGEASPGTLRILHAGDVGTSVRINATDVALDVRQVSGSVNSVEVASQQISLGIFQASGFADSVNILQLNGTTVDTNLGDASAGTLRTVLAHSANATTAAVTVGSDASTNVVPTTVLRKSVVVSHNVAGTLYVATGVAASTTSFPLKQNQSISFDDYVGPINAIAQESDAGTISVRYIEIV